MRNGRGRLIGSVLAAAILMVVLAGCTTFDSFKHTFIDEPSDTSNKILIGVFEPQSGKYAEKGLDEIKGIELAHSIYSSVDGYDVELVKVDTQSSASVAETAIQGLIEMKPVAIIGSEGEATSLVASKYISDAKIPAITPSATNPLITQNCPYYFRASITSYQMGSGVAEYAYSELGSTHIAVITAKNDTAATALMDGFDDKIKELAGKKSKAVVMQEETSMSDKEIASLIKSMKAASVDTVFMPMGTESMDRFFKAVEKNNLTSVTFIGTQAWGEEDFIGMMEKHPKIKVAFPYESVLSSSNSTSDALTAEAQRFQIEYANKYGSDDQPSHYAALGYDSYLLIINAIHNADTLDGPSVKFALSRIKGFKGATGEFAFDNNGNTVRSVNISTIKGGKVVSIYITVSTTEAKELEVKTEEEQKKTDEDKDDEDEDDEDDEDSSEDKSDSEKEDK